MKTLRLAPFFGALLLFALAGCRSSQDMAMDRDAMDGTFTLDLAGTSPSNSVLENAMAVEELSALVGAVQAAGLVDALSGDGPFTIFAPTNDAFARADVDPSNTDALRNTLLYHVVEGNVMAGDLSDGMIVETLSGEEASISLGTGEPTPRIDDADILYSDLESSNGVIHVINLVLNPTPGS